MSRAILWFRDDLRLDDNPALLTAIGECDEIVPVYILDERRLERDRWGFRRTGPYRLRFLLESLYDLSEALRDKGGGLIVRKGLPEKELSRLAQEFRCRRLYASKAYTHEEIQVEKALEEYLDVRLYHNSTLFHPEELPFAVDQLPEVFTQFRKRVERYAKVPAPVSPPDEITVPELPDTCIPSPESLGQPAPPFDERAVLEFKGGEMEAYSRLDHYFWNTGSLSNYKETRNGLIGADYSSKFSPWLARGCISARTIYHEVESYEAEVERNKSTYWLKFELLWREYFRLVAMRYGRRIFFPGGIQGKSVNWRDNDKVFYRWQTGATGDDFVDANMRELLFTGFMSNRGRQNVASYLVHRLKQDWRKGAAWFESLLIDYDVCSNYGNWMYAAGVGNDPRDRVFNTQKQASMYDEDGAYRRLWMEDKDKAPAAFMDQYLQ
ncbi:MAG: DASH family cryptochrome [Phaeodactylibacter sp.]|nr:DASH family cryptochrome [Phaeodactylibacter sp.]